MLVEGTNANFLARGNIKKIFKQEKEIISWARESVVSIKKIFPGEKLSQKNIATKDSDETKPIIKTDVSESKQKTEKVKSEESKTKAKVNAKETKSKGKNPTVEKKTTSIFSKIKKLASKKSK